MNRPPRHSHSTFAAGAPTSRPTYRDDIAPLCFGVGWGLAGYCPGPGLAAAGSGATTGLIFVAAMTGGMFLYQLFDKLVLSKTGEETKASKEDTGSLVGEKVSV